MWNRVKTVRTSSGGGATRAGLGLVVACGIAVAVIAGGSSAASAADGTATATASPTTSATLTVIPVPDPSASCVNGKATFVYPSPDVSHAVAKPSAFTLAVGDHQLVHLTTTAGYTFQDGTKTTDDIVNTGLTCDTPPSNDCTKGQVKIHGTTPGNHKVVPVGSNAVYGFTHNNGCKPVTLTLHQNLLKDANPSGGPHATNVTFTVKGTDPNPGSISAPLLKPAKVNGVWYCYEQADVVLGGKIIATNRFKLSGQCGDTTPTPTPSTTTPSTPTTPASHHPGGHHTTPPTSTSTNYQQSSTPLGPKVVTDFVPSQPTAASINGGFNWTLLGFGLLALALLLGVIMAKGRIVRPGIVPTKE